MTGDVNLTHIREALLYVGSAHASVKRDALAEVEVTESQLELLAHAAEWQAERAGEAEEKAARCEAVIQAAREVVESRYGEIEQRDFYRLREAVAALEDGQ